MIGEESIESSPTRTGQVPTFSQPAASVAEHEAPADQQRVRRAQRVPQRLLSHLPAHGVVLRISTLSRGPSTTTSTTPATPSNANGPRPTDRSTPSCRNRTLTSTSCGSLSSRTCVRIDEASSGWCADHAGGKTQPNVHRRWFFNADGRYGQSM